MWGLNFMSEDDALQFLDVCSMPQHQHSKLVQASSTLSLYAPVPAQAQFSEVESQQIETQRVRHGSPKPEFCSSHQVDPDEILSISSGTSQSDPTVPRDFIAGLDPPKSVRTSRIGSVVGQQLEAAIFSQLEESFVDSDIEDINQETSNETDVTAHAQVHSDYMIAEVHDTTTAEIDSHQFGNEPEAKNEHYVAHTHVQTGTSLEQSDEHCLFHLDKQQQNDVAVVNYENGSQYVESYFEPVIPLPPVFVTADWIPVPQRAVLVNVVEQVEVSRIMSETLSSSPQLSAGMAGLQLSTVTVMPIDSQSSRWSSVAFRNDVDERLFWARDAQVMQDSLDDSARLNHAGGCLTDSGFMSNPSISVSPLVAAGVIDDGNRQWVSDGMTRTGSDLKAGTTTSNAASTATATVSSWSENDGVKVVDLFALNSVGDAAEMQSLMMEDELDGDGDSEGSSMRTAVDAEDMEKASDTASSKESGSCQRSDEFHGCCLTQMRRTGWLVMKTVLVQKNGKVAEAGKRKWKRYWAILTGTSLLMYHCDSIEQLTENSQPTARIDVTGAMAQAVHEYLKKDFVFCLTISSGYGFYLQAINEADTDSWIRAVYCVAAADVVECSDHTEITKTLKSRIQTLEEDIDSEVKMKKLAELQLSTVGKPVIRSTINDQIKSWVENIERLNMDVYQLKCYLSAVQGTELPNPQTALANVSKTTKVALGRLQWGFTVSSLHAIVCARRAVETGMKIPKNPMTSKTLRSKQAHSRRFLKASEVSGLKSLTFKMKSSGSKESFSEDQVRPFSLGVVAARRASVDNTVSSSESDAPVEVPAQQFIRSSLFCVIRVKLPNKQYAVMPLPGLTPMTVLESTQVRQQINPEEHFVVLRQKVHGVPETEIPDDDLLLEELVFDEVEILRKVIHTVSMTKAPEILFGFEAIAEVWESTSQSSYGCIVITQVDPGGLAELYGVVEGDEVLSVNDAVVQEIGLSPALQLIEDARLGVTLSLKLRSKRIDVSAVSTTDNIINQLIMPAPPSQEELTDDTLRCLLVPKPIALVEENEVGQISESSDSERTEPEQQFGSPPPEQCTAGDEDVCLPELSREQIDDLLRNTDELTKFVRSLHAYGINDIPPAKKLTREEKLHKCVAELVSTEKTYVKNLNILLHRYLQPMKSESFLKKEDLNALFGNLEEIIPFQSEFLESLTEATAVSVGLTTAASVRNMSFSIAGTFLYYAEHFKLYSAFCASHTRAHEVLNRDDPRLDAFLDARNPKKELSSSLDSLLILPIQRVLKYPLFLKEMHKLTEEGSSEHELLWDAISSVETVANYINEVQRVYDSYHTLFEMILKNARIKELGVRVSIDELVHQCSVMWLNPIDDMQKGWKKGLGPEMNCFVFQTVVVLLAPDKDRKGRKKDKALSASQEDFRYRKLLLASHTTMEDLADSDGVTNMWKLVHREPGSHTRKSFFFRSSSPEEKTAASDIFHKVLSERKCAIEKMVSALTPARRKRTSSSSSIVSLAAASPRLSLVRQVSDSDDVSSVASWPYASTAGSTRGLMSPRRQYRPDTEVLPEEYETYTDC